MLRFRKFQGRSADLLRSENRPSAPPGTFPARGGALQHQLTRLWASMKVAVPPIRDGAPHTPKLTPHEPPVLTGASSSFSLTTKNGENRGKKAPSEHFDNKSSIWPAAPTVPGFFLMGAFPLIPVQVLCCILHISGRNSR